MGWSSIHIGHMYRPSPKDVLDAYIRHCEIQCYDIRNPKVQPFKVVMKSAKLGHGVILWEHTREDGSTQVFFEVVLLSYNKSSGYLSYKSMDEACGPYTGLPSLKMLRKAEELGPPPAYEYALNWRQKCWECYKSVKDNPYTQERIQAILKQDARNKKLEML